MTKNEKNALAVIATDVKWVKETLASMDEHFKTLNNNVAKNTLQIAVNKEAIGSNGRISNRQWGVIGGIISAFIALKTTGVI